jgi:hypothetical protein
MSFIDVDQKLSPVLDDVNRVTAYRIQMTVLRAIGIDSELFVYRTSDAVYQYVAALYDLKKWPADRQEARAQGLDFYRAPGVDLTYQDGALAQVAAGDIQRRLTLVVKDWDNQPNSFPSESVVTIQGKTNG